MRFPSRQYAAALLSVVAVASAANAQVVINGTRDAIYGTANAIQNTQTNFGKSTTGTIGNANGSQLDGGYTYRNGTSLFIFLAGNLETNFNKLEIFLDTKAGGQNVLAANNPNIDSDGLNRMSGLKFDAGFSPDHWFSVTGGGGTPDLFANYAQLLTAGGGTGGFAGQTTYGSNGVLSGGTSGPFKVTINNSNTSGVAAGAGTDNGVLSAGVTTGIELEIPLSMIDNPAGDVTISAFINGSSHDFLSNQVLGGIGGGGNLGDPHTVDFTTIAGNQFFVSPVPEPSTFLLTGSVVAWAAWRRRRVAKA